MKCTGRNFSVQKQLKVLPAGLHSNASRMAEQECKLVQGLMLYFAKRRPCPRERGPLRMGQGL